MSHRDPDVTATGATVLGPLGSSSLPASQGPRSVDALSPGQTLDGRYRLVARIGRGGFGDVWHAVELLYDGTPLRDVALKLLAPEIADPSWAEEAKLLASLSHPSLVSIHAAGILAGPGLPFVAMELLRGETLGELLARRGALPWRHALRICRDVAAALDVIHARGVVHLDLKPANLFVTREGAVKMLDFGISERAGARSGRSAPLEPGRSLLDSRLDLGSSDPFAATVNAAPSAPTSESARAVVGTPGFVAPEVLSYAEPTWAADAYALGVTLALLATGELPQALTVPEPDERDPSSAVRWWNELREATLHAKLRDLERLGLPRGVAHLVRRLLDVEPAARGAGAGQLRKDFDEAWQRPHGAPLHPYPGAEPYGAAHEGFLAGRTEEIARMARHLEFESTLVVAAPAGAGKTSMLRAGLVPELERSGIDGRLEVRVVWIDLGEGDEDGALLELLGSPSSSTARASSTGPGDARASGHDEGGGDEAPSSVAHARTAELGALSRLLDTSEQALLVVFDRLELLASASSAQRARALLAESLRSAPVAGLRVVGLVDLDGLEGLVGCAGIGEALAPALRQLAAPSAAHAEEIALEPARRAGFAVRGADPLVAAVARELETAGASLAVVALALHDWFEAERLRGGARAVLDGEAFLRDGGVAARVHAAADRAYQGLEPSLRATADELFVLLSTTEGRPVALRLEELSAELGDEERCALATRELTERRLLRRRGELVELAHGSLAAWPVLVQLRLSAMDRLSTKERLREAAIAWERSGQHEEYLDRGELLHAVERSGGASRRLSGVEVEFLEASRRKLRARRARYVALVGVVLVAMLSVWLGKRSLDARRLEAEAEQAIAERRARIAQLVARARQSPDPYERVALLVEALRDGADDPALGLELAGASRDLAPARFLYHGPIEGVDMPWDERWVIGVAAGGGFVAVDLRPPTGELELDEADELDARPERFEELRRKPRVHELALDAPIVELSPLDWDHAVWLRTTRGRTSLVRLRESGELGIADVGPFSCRGSVVVAERAAVAACPTERGFGVWDFARGERAEHELPVASLALSADGATVAGWSGRSLVVAPSFTPSANRVVRRSLEVEQASFSPRDRVLAVASRGHVELLDATSPERVLFELEGSAEPGALRWDPSGLELAVCSVDGSGAWHHLGLGARPEGSVPPRGGCATRSPSAPVLVQSRRSLGALGRRELGRHASTGGFLLSDQRFVSRTLVSLRTNDDSLERVLRFDRRSATGEVEPVRPDEGVSALERAGELVVLELGPSSSGATPGSPELVALRARTGERMLSRQGKLLGGCGDGRVLGYRVSGDAWEVFDVLSGGELARLERRPAMVLGVGPRCRALYLQDTDARLSVFDLETRELRAIRSLAGYVHELVPNLRHDERATWMASSDGAVLRFDEPTRELVEVARAVPRATALAEGPAPGSVVYGDAAGVHLVRATGEAELLLGASGTVPWTSARVTRDLRALVLASPESLAVVDLEAEALVGSLAAGGHSRLADWDDEGSMLAYPGDLEGTRAALVLPFGRSTQRAIGALASNLRVDARGRVVLPR